MLRSLSSEGVYFSSQVGTEKGIPPGLLFDRHTCHHFLANALSAVIMRPWNRGFAGLSTTNLKISRGDSEVKERSCNVFKYSR